MTETQITHPNTIPVKNPSGLRTLVQSLFTSFRGIAILYLVALTIAETLTNLIEPRAGMVAHGLVLVALLLQASFTRRQAQRRFLLVLALAPLIRLLSLSLPLPAFPFVYWYLLVGTLLFIAAFVAARVGKMNKGMVGLNFKSLPVQILVAATGIGLGYLEYLILQPNPLVAELRWQLVLVPALILLVFTGLLEEVIFRGMMQYTALRNFGRLGLVYVAMVFAVLHLGYHSALDIIFVFVVAMYFGWVALRTGSILGVSLSHGLTNITLYLVFPLLLVSPTVQGTVPKPPALESQPGLLAPVATVPTSRPWLPPTATPNDTPTPTQSPARLVSPTPQLALLTDTATPIPTPPCGPPAGWVRYTVQNGDSVALLSQLLDVDGATLRQANCLETNTIQVGQVIYVPFQPPPHGLPTATPRPPATRTPTFVPHRPTFTPTPLPPPSSTPPSTPTARPTRTASPIPTFGATETPHSTNTPLPTYTPLPPLPTDTSLPPPHSYTPAPTPLGTAPS